MLTGPKGKIEISISDDRLHYSVMAIDSPKKRVNQLGKYSESTPSNKTEELVCKTVIFSKDGLVNSEESILLYNSWIEIQKTSMDNKGNIYLLSREQNPEKKADVKYIFKLRKVTANGDSNQGDRI